MNRDLNYAHNFYVLKFHTNLMSLKNLVNKYYYFLKHIKQ